MDSNYPKSIYWNEILIGARSIEILSIESTYLNLNSYYIYVWVEDNWY